MNMSNKHSLQSTELNEVMRILSEFDLIDVHCLKFDIQHIAAGTINRNFRVLDRNKSVLLKFFQQSDVLPIDRNAIFELQHQLSIIGMAPQPLLLNDTNSIYFEQWVDGLEHHQAVANNAEAIPLLADSLYGIHNAYIAAPDLALQRHWTMYWQQIPTPNASLIDTYNTICTELFNYQQAYKCEFVLCHNDLNIDHICQNNGLIIDWEYAATGCRYFDIANCATVNTLNEEQLFDLCSKYAELSDQSVDEVLHRVQNMFKFVHFTNKLWRISVGLQSLDE